MESNFFNVFEGRRSVRRYLAKKVEDDLLFKVLSNAHNNSPAAGNLDNWHFVVVEDDSKRLSLSVEANHQYWLGEAPVLVVVLSDTSRLSRVFGHKLGSFYAIQNVACVINNVLLTAESLGLAGCWVGSFDEGAVKRLIGCEDTDFHVHAIISLGYPAEKPPKPKRLDLNHVISFEEKGRKRYD